MAHDNETPTPADAGPVELGLGPLPEPAAWQCYWRGDNDSTSWDQWHDASDPLPDEWDSDAPDEVTPHFTADQMRAYAAAARAQALEQAAAIKTFPVGISGLDADSPAGKVYARAIEHYRLAIKAMPR